MTVTFDFRDGNGAVAAHQHANGGGWVADTAAVSKSAYVGPTAKVYGEARVYGNAQIAGCAQVYGNAQVYGDSRVYGEAKIYGSAHVYGRARVSNTALVYGDAHVHGEALVHGNARVCGDARILDTILMANRSDGWTFSIFRCSDGVVRFTAGCRYFTYKEAVRHWASTRGDTRLGRESIILINHLKTMFDLQSE